MENNLLNGFNDGLHRSSGVGGKHPNEFENKIDESKVIKVKPVVIKEGESKPKKHTKQFKKK